MTASGPAWPNALAPDKGDAPASGKRNAVIGVSTAARHRFVPPPAIPLGEFGC
jgi:hypothetical protein